MLVKAPAASTMPSTRRCCRPWLDASIARWVTPSLAREARIECSSIGSGVVWFSVLVPRGPTTPTVPRLAARNPSAVQIWRTKEVTEVLPLVPVTATTVLGWRAKKRAAISARRWRGSLSSMTGSEVEGRAHSLGDEDRGSTPLHGLVDEARAVRLHAGKRGEEIAGHNLAAVGGEPRYRDAGPRLRQLRLRPDQLTQSHSRTRPKKAPVSLQNSRAWQIPNGERVL